MAGEGEDEALAIELQLEQHLQEQRSSLAAVDEALASDPSNADLLEVHEELLAAIKDAEEGLLHLKRSRLVKQIDEIFPNQESTSQAPEVAVEPLDPDDVEPEPLEPQEFSIGSKCRFRHKDGRWYNGCVIGLEGSRDARISFLTPTSENMSMCKFFLQQRCRFGSNCRLSHGIVIPTSSLKRFTPTRWQQSLVGSSILASSGHHSGLWRRAELGSWNDDLKLGQVVFQDDGSSARIQSDSLSISEYADMSGEDDEGSSSEEESEFSEDGDQDDESIHQGLGLLESTNFSGVQSETVIFAKWENHTRGVASKMMAKMGYREGMGLGVSGQGMLEPIPVKVLPPKQSLDHAVAASADNGTIGRGKRRSRGGKRKREKKFAEQARAAKAEEAEWSVFSFINSQLVGQDVAEGSATKVRKESSGEANGHAKEDRRSLVVYDDEVKELKSRVEKLEEMMKRNRKDKAVYEAAARKLEQTRKALADAEATHSSAITTPRLSRGNIDQFLADPNRWSKIKLGANMPARAEVTARKNDCESQLIEEPTGEYYDVILYFGIIDILQDYDISKKLEHAYKSFQYDPTSISAVDPRQYSRRFKDFIYKAFQEDKLDRRKHIEAWELPQAPSADEL